MKKITKFLFGIVVLFISALLFNGCSCSTGYFVKVNFKDVPEDVKVESYVKEVQFEGSHKIEFTIPEGFDESELAIDINGRKVEYDVEYIKANDIDEDYLYCVGKKISFEVTGIKRSVYVNIDMSEMLKKTFDVSFKYDVGTSFQLVTINPDDVSRLLSLSDDNIVKKATFIDGKVDVTYGDYVAVVYTPSIDEESYSMLYSKTNYFSKFLEKEKIKTLNGTDYLEYPVAKRGNNYYHFNGNSANRIYYIGQIKDNVELEFTIPNYVADNKMHIGDEYNTFYLLTNMQKYNSDLISIETFIENPNVSYSINDKSVDKINGVKLSKINPSADYYDRYDMHKIYLGDDLSKDSLLNTVDKENLYSAIYFKVASEVGVENLDVRLLMNEKYFWNEYTKLENSLLSDKGNTYYKITKKELENYYDKVEFAQGENSVEYFSGAAVLYVGIDRDYEEEIGHEAYATFSLKTEIANEIVGDCEKNLHLVPYVFDENGDRDYGYTDFHKYTHLDVFYLRTDKIFDTNGNYKKNLYVDVFGEEYNGYTSTRLNTINIIWSVGEYLTKLPLEVEDYKVYNGYEGYLLQSHLIKKHKLNEYIITAEVTFNDVEKNNYTVDFSNLELPESLNDVIYVTNNFDITSLGSFEGIITHYSKDTYSGVNFGYSRELYYLIISKNLKDFSMDMYLDENKEKLVSFDGVLKDIAGNKVIVTVNGEPFEVRYKYMSISYEVPDGNKYHMCSN